ncbi:Calcium release-activated calcium channel protein 1 [Hondaea fermentalgiana]|uniref:Calcium release-activated calcium channel protein 1 n=1 Tax=Hondaea fermentalgiana TaxID=2315210 RepID=A0A2R5G3Z6_9STRA|nr:Calcium release-activated calcium channel protein 1 [Hondaea fermentalgiana]|eukprot:GBG25720.1 Calcium release-activated calcium channel protein 1 [Hondaea fermentalgiana]
MAELFNAGLALADVHLATKWREEEIKYRKLEILRRQIDEKVEQLRSIANLAALIAGFSVVVLIELNIPSNDVPAVLIGLWALSTAITVCIMSLSFVICTLMLVGVLKAFDLERAKMPFQQFWVLRCEEDWMRAFWFFTIGVPMFMLNLALAGWVLFFEYLPIAGLITVICAVAIMYWLSIHLKWGSYLAEQATFNVEHMPSEASQRRINSQHQGSHRGRTLHEAGAAASGSGRLQHEDHDDFLHDMTMGNEMGGADDLEGAARSTATPYSRSTQPASSRLATNV